MVVGPKGSFFGSDQGGNIELGTDNGTANTVGAVPYIDFHYGTGTIQDFNTRLQNDANGQLSIIGNARVSSLTTAGIVTNNASGVLSTTTTIPVGNLPDATTSTKGIVQLAGDLAGTAASPQIAAGAIVDADINGSANIADTKLATISTAGKVSNSATTATSANTPNAIVARDGSGNFSAGTITATLNGNATSATNIAGGSAGKVPYQTAAGTTTFTATSPAAAGVYMRSSGANTWDATAIQVGDLPASVSGAWTRSAPNVSLVTSTDKVGIGTSTPGAKLQVYEPTALGATAGNSQILSRFSGDVGNHFMNNTWLYRDASSPTSWQTARLHDGISVDASFLTPGSDTRVWWERDPNDNIQSWGNANATYLTINAGNIGIGTTAPLQKLEVNTGGIGFSGSGLNSADKKLYSPADGDLEWMTHTGAGVHGFAISHQGAKAVYLNISGNSYLNGGNVGIGTASPGYKLEVVGTGRFGNAANAYVYTASGATTGAGGIEIFGSGNVGYIRFHDPGVAWRDLALNDAGGNVGIGTATPAYKLDVNGNFRTTGQALVQGGLLTQGTASTLYGTNASIYANNANVTGGGLMISDDGGFFDYNDGPVTFNGSTGLRIAGTSGAASSNGYLRVNALSGSGNRTVFADANGILKAGSKNVAYVQDRAERLTGTANTGYANIGLGTNDLAVEAGDIITIRISLKFRWTGGSGGDHPRFGVGITGCTTASVDDTYYHRLADDSPRGEYQSLCYQYVYVATCTGNLQFYMRMDNNSDADDQSATGDVVIIATRH